MRKLRGLSDILVAYLPLLVFGFIGQRIGLQTVLSGMVISVGYVLTLLVATWILGVRGSSWRDNGMARPQSWLRTTLWALATTVGAIGVILAVTVIVTNLPGFKIAGPDVSRFNPLEGNLPLFLGYLVLAWTVIAFGEEMFFRAFLTDRLAEVFHDARRRWTLAALGSTLAFGLAHYGEGLAGIFSNGAFGLLFVVVYLRTGRNLWITLIAHGLLNTIRFTLVYLGAA